jgi:membrane protease YdiL (CAAX protease family)
MNDDSVSMPKVSAATWFGLLLALFGLLIVREIVVAFGPATLFSTTVWKESLNWLCAILLLVIIRRGEGLPFTSVGLGTSSLTKSILWGLVLMAVCAVVGGIIATLTHFNGGPTGTALSKLPLWLTTLVVIRAGVVEELFYRGYAIERLQSLGLNRYAAAAVPLLIFGIGHWTGGWANVAIALALGAVLSASYLWRRDLVANMIGHFLVDFGIILPRLFSHS